MAEADDEQRRGCRGWCLFVILIVALFIIAGLVYICVYYGASRPPVYSVTITGVAGLDPAADRPTLSPVFNLTVRIDNARNRECIACIGRLSTAAVSYGDAFLGRGSVPEFCAKEKKVQERRARAWGQDVPVPRFLRDQLAGELAAGEAYLDVKVTTPAEGSCGSDTVLICSKVKIGGGPARLLRA